MINKLYELTNEISIQYETSIPPQQSSPIGERMDRMEKVIFGLNEAISCLSARLTPIMLPMDAKLCAEMKDTIQLSKMAQMLDDYISEIEKAASRISEINNLIQL